MGKKSPKAPDPVTTAKAQTDMNKDTATWNAGLNRINEFTPYGSSTYSYGGVDASGVPQYSRTITLDPAQQALYDKDNAIQGQMYDLAGQSVGRVKNAMGNDIDMSGAPALSGGVQGGPIQGGVGGYGSVKTDAGFTPSNYDRRSISGSPVNANPIQMQLGTAGPIQSGLMGAGRVRGGFGDVGDVQRNAGDAGEIQTNLGNRGAIRGDAGQRGQIRGDLGFDGLMGIAGQNDFGAERQRVEDAQYGRAATRLDRAFGQREDRLRNQLANQGLTQGSEAWNNAMQDFSTGRNDAYASAMNDAIMAGGAEQSRLFGQSLSSRQQLAGEKAQQGAFANQAQAQGFGQNVAETQLANQAQEQDFNQRVAGGQFGNQAQQQYYAQQMGRQQAGNQAQQQAYDQAMGRAQFGNQAQAQRFGQGMAAGAFGNQAQQQYFNQLMAGQQSNNAAQQQAFQQSMAGAQFGNQAQAQAFDQSAQIRQQALAEALAQGGFQNDAQQQQYQQALGAGAFANQAQQQAYQQQIANAQQNNAARQQAFQEQGYLRNLPINEIAALLGTGSGVQNPTFTTPGQAQAGEADYMGMVQNAYNSKLASSNNFMGGLMGMGGTLGGAAIARSDIRLKHDIVRVGNTPVMGLPLYDFRYIEDGDDGPVYTGVMAQEVLDVAPDAVIVMDNGFYAVDYSKVS